MRKLWWLLSLAVLLAGCGTGTTTPGLPLAAGKPTLLFFTTPG